MKEHPILFSTEMVKANLLDTKTMTRRIIKHQPNIDNQTGDWLYKSAFDGHEEVHPIEDWKRITAEQCKYKVGDLLWVREKWKPNTSAIGWPYHYYALNDTFARPDEEKWKPSLFMPYKAARLWLLITRIKAERLHDITEDDAIKEGVERMIVNDRVCYRDYLYKKDIHFQPDINAIDSFRTLWFNINGYESWKANPFVYVIEYKVVSKSGKNIVQGKGTITVPEWSIENKFLSESPHCKKDERK